MNKCYQNISELLTLQGVYDKNGRNPKSADKSIIKNGAIIFSNDEILWVGKTEDIPKDIKIEKTLNLQGKSLTPEIVDSHTHLVFGGDRSTEYGMRLDGADYQEIANSGGGILSTMKKTRDLSIDQLIEVGKQRVKRIHSYGIGTIEIKSGYGLDYENEKKISLAIHELKKFFSGRIQIFNTFMAAHAIPPEFISAKDYIQNICNPLLIELSQDGIIDAVDIFHEKGYFDEDSVELLFECAKKQSIPTKIHADEFNDNNGLKIALENESLSADHLLRSSEENILNLKNYNTVATLLPGTGYFLGKEQSKARLFYDSGAKVALASDYNPGSCHCDNLLLIASIAAPNLKITTAELWSSITLNAAHALGLKNQGAIVKGLKPRFSIFDCESIDSITYNWGKNLSIDESLI